MKGRRFIQELTIQRVREVLNDAGTPVSTWAKLANLRAEKVELSTTEFIRNYGAAEETVAVFRTRFLEGVTTADRVIFSGEAFNIKQVSPIGRNRGLELRCVRLE